MSAITPTRGAFLALREEREGMREGYRFLDEKRLVLAAEILAGLRRHEIAQARLRLAWAEALRALRAAVARHGLEGLFDYPPWPAGIDLDLERRALLGVPLIEARTAALPAPSAPPLPINASPEAEHCRRVFARLLPELAEIAAQAANLERLRLEYQRTSRRARALEDVLLPEMARDLDFLDNALEEQDQEEAVRTRHARREAC
jgi:V/A-type H+/Na+-transporting ATPase subunit D